MFSTVVTPLFMNSKHRIFGWMGAALCFLGVELRADQVVFSELMYHPPGALPEFIEVYNSTATPLDMAEWKLRGGVDYDFPKFNATDTRRTFLKPFERILLSPVAEALLRASYNIPATTRIYGPWSGNLDNAGERITLQDKMGVPLCTLAYDNRGYWPVAADGTGHSLVLKDALKNVDDWRNWTFSKARLGTPGTDTGTPLPSALRLNEVHFSPSNTLDWVELYNATNTPVTLSGLGLASRADFSDRLDLDGSLVGLGIGSLDVDLPAEEEVVVYLLDATNNVLAARAFSRSAAGASLQAFPDGSSEWYGAAVSTRDATNNPARDTAIIINEIMYDPPSDEVSAEFVELYNRSTNAVDLSGWRFAEGIDFVFPAGTRVEPDGYVVVASDVAWMRSTYGAIPVLGNYEGRLANNGELLRLVDQWGNLVDEVDYRHGGSWPNLAHGDGTSMELRHPSMNNDLPSAWADSNETNKTTFTHFAFTDVFRQLSVSGSQTDYKELHLHLVGDSHVILRNVQLRLNGTGTNIITRGNAMSADGRSASGWLAQGTHWLSHLENGDLHLIADGHGDNRPNRVEIDATAMQNGSSYEVSFDARWVAGASRLVVQSWDHSLGGNFALPVPKNLGTPGFRNSRTLLLPGPQVDRLLHSPAVPAPGQVVRVTAVVASPQAFPTVQLFHRPDNVTGNAAWANKPMFDDGSNGDERAGDGIYTAQLPEYIANGQVVEFYVVATVNGQTSQLPKLGVANPAMYVVDTPTAAGDLRRMRFVVSAHDLQAIANQDSPTPGYGYSHPRLSNHYYNMTLIVNEQEVIYNCEVRTSGSPWTRSGSLDRGKFKVPRDRLLRGKEKLSYDNDAAGGARHHNRLMRYWLYLFDHPANENEYFILEVNNRGTNLREEVEPMGNDLLDRVYPDGSQGELYRIDDEWWFTDDWGRTSRNADWSYKGSDNAARYHSEWMKRTRENEYDYSSLVNMFKTVSANNYTQASIERLIDPVAVMKMSAIRGYVHDWDSFSLDRGKNGYLYRRSTDGRFMFFHWDSDLAFDNTSAAFYNGMTGFRPYLEKPYNLRLFKHYLAVLVENYAKNSPRLTTWLQLEEEASTQYTVAATTYTGWFNGRETPAITFLGAGRNMAFDITSNAGNPISTAADTLTLTGTGPLRVNRVSVVGHPEAIFVWTSETAWNLSGIRLRSGADTLTLQALDDNGNLLYTDTITVTKSGNAPPVMSVQAKPSSWHASLLEPFEADASASYDPDGGVLAYDWTTPVDAQVEVRPASHVTAYFPHPGLYSFTVTGTDPGGASTSNTREAAVYAPNGFSSFDAPRLDSFWKLENLVVRENSGSVPYCSVTELPGNLVLQVQPIRAYPLGSAVPTYPFLWRSLPALTDWALLTQVGTRAQVFGDFFSGLMAELNEDGASVRYAFGIEDGTSLNVRRATGAGSTALRTLPITTSEIDIRIRREGNSLFFEQRTNGVWALVHSTGLPTDSAAGRGGVFLATDTPQMIKTSFDYVILVDPAAGADLHHNLRISEIMYNPPSGGDYEFVELANIGTTALDLTGVRFTAGIDYTFGPTVLGPRQYLIVAKNRAAFASHYNTTALNLAAGEFLGQLNNAGETLELSDTNGVVFLSVTYSDSGAWPTEADGAGSSLEVANASGNLNDPLNWRASPEAGGSPGRPGGDALGSVVINEVLTHTDPPFEDAIEVYNRTAAPLNIGGWFLSDSKADFKKYRIPDNTLVPAQGFKVFYELEFNTANPLVPFSLSSANGDQVYLSAADAAGNLTGYRSAVDFDAAANGVSFGRYETSQGRDFPPLLARSFGQDSPSDLNQFRTGTGLPNAAPNIGPLVVNEIMYHPPDVDGTNDNVLDEFVEVHNITAQPLPLFDPANPTNTWRLRGGVDFDFPQGITLPARSFALLVSFDPVTNLTAASAFRLTYGLPEAVRLYGPFQGKLDNGGEEVKLTRPDVPQTNGFVPYVLVDRVIYADAYPWSSAPDGAGQSLQRRRPHDYGNDPVNWKAVAPTPGQANQPDWGYDDTDADGMPDRYENAHSLAVNDPSDAALDADGDGRSNYEEFLDGTNPRDPNERLIKPTYTVMPQSQVVSAGTQVTFTTAGTGTAPLFYQWRINGRALSGATNATLTIPSAKTAHVGEYSVVLYNAAGFAISAGAELHINEPLEILAQPQGQIVDRGSTVQFQVFAAGTGLLHYQWRRDGLDLAGATSSLLVLSNVEPEDGGNYSVVVSDNSGSLSSADATLSVLRPPIIVEQPQAKTAVAYTDVFFSVTAGGEGPFTYQWRFNGLPILGATTATLGLPNVQPGQAGVYTVEVFNPVASVVSEGALLSLLIPATVVQQPQSINVAPGATATFTVLATSSTPMTYQWRYNDVDIPGATNTTLSVTNAQLVNEGNYYVEIKDSISSLRSQVATLGIIIPLAVVQGPLSQLVPEGGSVTLSAEVRGGPLPYGFEWRRVSTPIQSNASFSAKSFLTLTNLQLTNSTGYRVVVRTAVNTSGVPSTPIAQITVVPDFDRDGLPDVYEVAIGLDTNNVADALTDLDADGVSNYREYLAGTDPLDPASYFRVDEEIENGITTVMFSASSNKTYTVEFTDNLSLGQWTKLDDLVAYSTNHVRRLVDPGANQNRFYRLISPRRP
jgi:hypothetical protein